MLSELKSDCELDWELLKSDCELDWELESDCELDCELSRMTASSGSSHCQLPQRL